jgi:hypothetical protein
MAETNRSWLLTITFDPVRRAKSGQQNSAFKRSS